MTPSAKSLVCLILASVLFACVGSPAETPPELESCELLERILKLEAATAGADHEEAAKLLRAFAEETTGRAIRVESGAVLGVYRREGWRTRPYYALTYDRETYLYLEELDSEFQEQLARHLPWISVSSMCPGRQLVFEVAVDEEAFSTLEVGDRISLTCEAAAVIRGGKSIYSRLISLHQKVPGDSRPLGTTRLP